MRLTIEIVIIQKDVLVRHKEIWLRHYFIVKLNNSTKYFLFFYFNDNKEFRNIVFIVWKMDQLID